MTIILKNDINIYFPYYFYYVMPRKKNHFSRARTNVLYLFIAKNQT